MSTQRCDPRLARWLHNSYISRTSYTPVRKHQVNIKDMKYIVHGYKNQNESNFKLTLEAVRKVTHSFQQTRSKVSLKFTSIKYVKTSQLPISGEFLK